MTLPTDRDARNAIPIWDGVINYFPDVWAEIAKVSVLGNVQHNLGKKLHFNRDVSTDHLNKVFRHALDHEGGNVFDDGGKTRHLAKAAWRILAALQVSIETDAKIKQPDKKVCGATWDADYLQAEFICIHCGARADEHARRGG